MSAGVQTSPLGVRYKWPVMHSTYRDHAAARALSGERSFVDIDFRGCSPQELSERYQSFGLLCARGKVGSAMLKTGHEDADAHYTLRDILVTVTCIVGIPLGFRLALVATTDSIELVYRTILEDLHGLGCEARIFRNEAQAAGWLHAGRQWSPPAPLEARAGSHGSDRPHAVQAP